MKNELTDMTVKELRSHAKEVAKEIARREGERLSRARESLGENAREFGTSIEGLFGKSMSKPKTTKSESNTPKKVRYIDDSGNEWGRAKPSWTEVQKKKFKSNCEKKHSS